MHFYFGHMNCDVIVSVVKILYRKKDANRNQDPYHNVTHIRLTFLGISFAYEIHFFLFLNEFCVRTT